MPALSESLFNPSIRVSTHPARPNFVITEPKVFPTDEVSLETLFSIDTAVFTPSIIRNLKLKSAKTQIISETITSQDWVQFGDQWTGRKFFVLEEVISDLSTQPRYVDGTPRVFYEVNRNFNLPLGDFARLINYKSNDTLDGTKREYTFIMPILFRWEYWKALLSVNDEFLNYSLPQNGKNNFWERFQKDEVVTFSAITYFGVGSATNWVLSGSPTDKRQHDFKIVYVGGGSPYELYVDDVFINSFSGATITTNGITISASSTAGENVNEYYTFNVQYQPAWQLKFISQIVFSYNGIDYPITSSKVINANDYDSNSQWKNKTIKTYDGSTELPLTVQGDLDIMSDKNTKVIVSLERDGTWDELTLGGTTYNEEDMLSGVVKLEPFEGGGVTEIMRGSTTANNTPESCFTAQGSPFTGKGAKLTVTGQIVTIEATIDYTKLPKKNKFEIYGRLYNNFPEFNITIVYNTLAGGVFALGSVTNSTNAGTGTITKDNGSNKMRLTINTGTTWHVGDTLAQGGVTAVVTSYSFTPF